MGTLVDISKYLEQLSLALGEEAVFIDQIELEGLVIQLTGAASARHLVFSEAGFLAHPLLVIAIFPSFSDGVSRLVGLDGLAGPDSWKTLGFNIVAQALEALLQDASRGVVEWSDAVFGQAGACPIKAIEAVTADNRSADQMETRLKFKAGGLRAVQSDITT